MGSIRSAPQERLFVEYGDGQALSGVDCCAAVVYVLDYVDYTAHVLLFGAVVAGYLPEGVPLFHPVGGCLGVLIGGLVGGDEDTYCEDYHSGAYCYHQGQGCDCLAPCLEVPPLEKSVVGVRAASVSGIHVVLSGAGGLAACVPFWEHSPAPVTCLLGGFFGEEHFSQECGQIVCGGGVDGLPLCALPFCPDFLVIVYQPATLGQVLNDPVLGGAVPDEVRFIPGDLPVSQPFPFCPADSHSVHRGGVLGQPANDNHPPAIDLHFFQSAGQLGHIPHSLGLGVRRGVLGSQLGEPVGVSVQVGEGSVHIED